MRNIGPNNTVLITGVTGYIASWIAKILLENGVNVNGTVRDLSKKEKYVHLLKVEKEMPGNLRLFEADLLIEDSFTEAMEKCDVVIHVASPYFFQNVKDAQKELIDPAVKGTKNIIDSMEQTPSVKKLVLTSSVMAIYGDNIDIKKTEAGVFTEKNWNITSNQSYNPYNYSETQAEVTAWRMKGKYQPWDLIVLNPGFVIGPSLTSRTNSTSIHFLIDMVKGVYKNGIPNLHYGFVDVRDVAQAHVNAAVMGCPSSRNILVGYEGKLKDLARIIKKKYGRRFPVSTKVIPKFMMSRRASKLNVSRAFIRKNVGIPVKFDNKRSKEVLKIEYTNFEKTVLDHFDQLIKNKII